MGEIKLKLRGFLDRYFRNYKLQEDEDIFAAGFVNSLFSMQLVLFLEKEFDIVIENEDMDISNFQSINAISEFVSRKTA